LSSVTKAGEEYIKQGFISDDIQEKLKTPLYPPEAFIEMANLSWEVDSVTQEAIEKEYRFLRQMAAIYKPHGEDKEIVIECYFTDAERTYQLVLGKTSCVCKKEEFLPYTIRIEVPFENWIAISDGKLNGKEALFQHKYRVIGNFSAITFLERCFSNKVNTKNTAEDKPKKRAMWLFIVPWTVFWMAVPLSPDFGVYIALAITAALPLFSAIRKLTVYDTVSVFFVTVLSILTITDCNLPIIVTGSYGLFSLLWLVSAVTPIPLSAWYSSERHGGNAAFNNPLFLLTNKIISIGWGIIYIISCLWIWSITHSYYIHLAGLVNMICPAIMGIFTAIFSKRFPAYYAGRPK
jgi:putative sterol carrier protein